jgi:hypothetical protein
VAPLHTIHPSNQSPFLHPQGLSESAGVASALFLAHMAVLTGLLLLGAVYACQNTHHFVANMQVRPCFVQRGGGRKVGGLGVCVCVCIHVGEVRLRARAEAAKHWGPNSIPTPSPLSDLSWMLVRLCVWHPI